MNIDRINVGGNLYDVCDTNARAMISDEYNSATQYNAGDYCIWENTLKKANKSTTGTYDHTAWDDTNIGEVVGELNQKMKKIYTTYATVKYESERGAYVLQDDSGIAWDSNPMVVAVNVATDRPRIVITATYYNNSEIFFTAMMDNELYTQDILAYIALIGD